MNYWVSPVLPFLSPTSLIFMTYFMHKNKASSKRCIKGWPAPYYLLMAQSLTLNILQKEAILHIGVYVMCVHPDIYFLFV